MQGANQSECRCFGVSGCFLNCVWLRLQNGKPVFNKYMDSFPFPFYIVMRDIAALPGTLADLLRQWFALSSTSD